MASKAPIVIGDAKLGTPYMLPESLGMDLVRVNDGIASSGIGKKRMASCNEIYRCCGDNFLTMETNFNKLLSNSSL